jgi:branched-chain amino acid transport system substrate-binding protein
MKPDAVFFGGMDSTAGPLLKQARAMGIGALFAFGDGACIDTMGELAGAAAEGLICTQSGIPVDAVSPSFVRSYREAFHTDPILYAPYTYDAAKVLIEAMKQADSTDPAVYAKSIRSIKLNGATGPIALDRKGDREEAEVTIFTMRDRRVQPVAIVRSREIFSFAQWRSRYRNDR